MTEQEWLASTEPAAMLDQLPPFDFHSGRLDRKLRLFADACRHEFFHGYLIEQGMWSGWESDGHLNARLRDEHLSAEQAARGWASEVTMHPWKADLMRHFFLPFRPWNAVTCGRCGGKGGGDPGYAMYGTSWERCKTCSGRGWLPGPSLPTRECGRCKGWEDRPCRRTVCAGLGADRRHKDTGEWYCPSCAAKINHACNQTLVGPCPECQGTRRLLALPAAVVGLAESVYNGERCEFALADALRIAGIGQQACGKCKGTARPQLRSDQCEVRSPSTGTVIIADRDRLPIRFPRQYSEDEIGEVIEQCRHCENGHVNPLADHFAGSRGCMRGCWAVDLLTGRG